MRTGERDVLLFILAIAAGSADGWSYAGLGHTFVANMTGNTVLLGMAVFEKNGDIADRLISMVCYLSGVALATWLNKNLTKDKIWTRSVSLVLLLEAALLIGAEAGWVAHQGGAPVILPVLLGMVAFAVGLQSGTMLQLSIPGIVTTYITGTWTTAISGLVKLGTSERSTPFRREAAVRRAHCHAAGHSRGVFAGCHTHGLVRAAPTRRDGSDSRSRRVARRRLRIGALWAGRWPEQKARWRSSMTFNVADFLRYPCLRAVHPGQVLPSQL